MMSRLFIALVAFGLGLLLASLGRARVPVAAIPAPLAATTTPATDGLETYACRKAETRHVLIGGQEDGFSPAGIERATPGALFEFMQSRTGSAGGIAATRDYDQGGFDNVFMERFDDLPPRIAHGRLVLRLRHLGNTNNDAVVFGEVTRPDEVSHMSALNLNPEAPLGPWTRQGDVYFADLGRLDLRQRFGTSGEALPQHYATLLDFVRDAARPLDVIVTDDTMVDMVGLALCSEPEERLGTTWRVDAMGSDLVHLSCNGANSRDDHCNPYAGDTQCDALRPLACFREERAAKPTLDVGMDALLMSWSGGRVGLTDPVRARDLPTREDAHALCRTTFGADYRVLNIHDGATATGMAGFGEPGTSRTAWVDSNLEPYGNCWDRDADYEGVGGG